MNTSIYNQDWCKERHEKLDKRMDSLETKFWAIIILLIANLTGVVTVLYTGG
jgi:hypothetical protein